MTFMLLSYYLSSLNLKSIFTASYWAFDVHYKTWRAPSSSPKWGLGAEMGVGGVELKTLEENLFGRVRREGVDFGGCFVLWG